MRFLFLMTAFSIALSGQEVDELDDIFSADNFDAAVEASKAEDKENQLEILVGTQFVAKSETIVPLDRVTYGTEADFSGKLFAKAIQPTVGQLFISYNFGLDLIAATNDDILRLYYSALSPENIAPEWTLGELHFSFDIGKAVFIRVGSQLLSWGAGAVWSPTDLVNRSPEVFGAAADLRQGKGGIRIHVPFETGNLFLFGDFSEMIIENKPGELTEDFGGYWRLDSTLAGINLGMVGALRKGDPPRLGADATTAVFGIDIYAEYLAALPHEGNKVMQAVSFGFSSDFGETQEFLIRGEGYWNQGGVADATISSLVPGTWKPLNLGVWYAYAELQWNNLLQSTLDLSLSGLGNLSDASYSVSAAALFELASLPLFTLTATYYGGPADREFTSLTGDNALGFSIRSKVEF